MGIHLGLVGLGAFGSVFARLFKAHPSVSRISLCDYEGERVRKFLDDPFMADKVSARDCYSSLDDICRSDADALVIITQPWLHAPQCIQALHSGKHVYSAVPVISIPDGEEILDWCGRIIEAADTSGRQYMLGETTVYRPCTMFCRRMAAEGRFGDFVYAEGEYSHDLDAPCSLREVTLARTTGVVGREYGALMERYVARGCKDGPMYYPTHSVSGPLSVMKTRARKVSAGGYRNANRDEFFRDYDFSDIAAFFYMANGATLRICEFREIGCLAMDRHEEETFRIFGTAASFARNVWEENHRRAPESVVRPIDHCSFTDAELRDPLPEAVAEAFKAVMNPDAKPEDDFVPEGHGGSHPYLVHEFCSAVAENRRPEVDAREAAAYMAMGVAAHRSACRDGELTEVAQFD